jgi:protein-export membrane protein SecD
MRLAPRLLLIFVIAFVSVLYVFPWEKYNIALPGAISQFIKPYKYGLDLHGGVELDYKVDLTAVRAQSGTQISESSVIESLKGIVDKRVGSLGLEEPTISTAQYGPGESHIIVQIPVKDYGDISEEEKRKRNAEDIAKAKDTIGKVVQIEFREEKNSITEADKKARKDLAEKALIEAKTTPFATVGAKYRDQYENVFYVSTGGVLIPQAKFEGIDAVTTFPYISPVHYVAGEESIGADEKGNPTTTRGPGGYAVTYLESMSQIDIPAVGTGAATKQKIYNYGLIYIDERPSLWEVAKTADGKSLSDKYLTRAGVSFTQAGASQVELIFNDEGKTIFGELTKRLLGKQIAIYVGGQMLTAPTVQAIISDGRAVITGDYTIASAQELANNINTGIVPAPIYLTSERTIDAKIGKNALDQIVKAGLIGLLAIVILLVTYYRIAGLIAGIALVFYTAFLIAIVKFAGVTLSLASIAGVILSIGLAIDANILIFERMREALRSGLHLEKATTVGFRQSWTAIWDSHITSLTSAVILYVFGISLIKGFGFMLGLGIVLSLFTAMWVSRILLIAVGRKMEGKTKTFIGV